MVNVIKRLYTDIQCRVAYTYNHLTDGIGIKSGVKHPCMLSPFLFNLAINCLMTETTPDVQTGASDGLNPGRCGLCRWYWSWHKDMQEKMETLAAAQKPQIGLKLDTANTTLMRNNHKTNTLPPPTVEPWKRFRNMYKPNHDNWRFR